jgi:uncharacterized membrane protein
MGRIWRARFIIRCILMIQLRQHDRPGAFDDPLLEAEIRPNFSVNPRLTRWVFILFAAACATIGISFWLVGAGPVIFFTGLEIVLVYVALRVSLRHAGTLEALRLTGAALTVHRVEPSGASRTTELQSYWLKISVDGPRGWGSMLTLRSKDLAVEVGSFLTKHERLQLADALTDALHRLKHGPLPSGAPSGV